MIFINLLLTTAALYYIFLYTFSGVLPFGGGSAPIGDKVNIEYQTSLIFISCMIIIINMWYAIVIIRELDSLNSAIEKIRKNFIFDDIG